MVQINYQKSQRISRTKYEVSDNAEGNKMGVMRILQWSSLPKQSRV